MKLNDSLSEINAVGFDDRSASVAVTPQPAMVGNDQPSDPVGNDQPSTVKIRRGAEAYRQLLRERGHAWARWRRVIIAVLEVDTLAMREAGKNKPKGAKFNKAVAKLLRLYELDIIHKSDRSRMRKFAGKLELIDAWRSEQSLERQFELNHPRVVYNAWNRAQGEKQPPKSGPKESEAAPDLAAVLSAATGDEVKAALKRTKDVAWLLRVLPEQWLGELEARVTNLRTRQNNGMLAEPHLKASEMVRRALSLVKIATTTPEITPAVAASNEKEAITTLCRLNVILADFETDEITIVRQHAKENRCVKSRSLRRAA